MFQNTAFPFLLFTVLVPFITNSEVRQQLQVELEECDRFQTLFYDSTNNPFLPCVKTSSGDWESDELQAEFSGSSNLVLLQEEGSEDGLLILSFTNTTPATALPAYNEGFLFLDVNTGQDVGIVYTTLCQIDYCFSDGALLITSNGRILLMDVTEENFVRVVIMRKNKTEKKWYAEKKPYWDIYSEYVTLGDVGVAQNGLVVVGLSKDYSKKKILYSAFSTMNLEQEPNVTWTYEGENGCSSSSSDCSFTFSKTSHGEEWVYFLEIDYGEKPYSEINVILSAVDSSTGEEKMKKKTIESHPGSSQVFVSPISVALPQKGPQYIYAIIGSFTWPATHTVIDLYALDKISGDTVWSFELENSASQIVISQDGNSVFFISKPSFSGGDYCFLHSVDTKYGKLNWNSSNLYSRNKNCASGSVIMNSEDGKVIVRFPSGGENLAVVIDQKSGKIDREIKMKEESWESQTIPVLDGNNNMFFCYTVKKGKSKCKKISLNSSE